MVISLSRPTDYSADKGAVFIADFTKARNLTGDDAQSVELELTGEDRVALVLEGRHPEALDREPPRIDEAAERDRPAEEVEVGRLGRVRLDAEGLLGVERRVLEEQVRELVVLETADDFETCCTVGGLQTAALELDIR